MFISLHNRALFKFLEIKKTHYLFFIRCCSVPFSFYAAISGVFGGRGRGEGRGGDSAFQRLSLNTERKNKK